MHKFELHREIYSRTFRQLSAGKSNANLSCQTMEAQHKEFSCTFVTELVRDRTAVIVNSFLLSFALYLVVC